MCKASTILRAWSAYAKSKKEDRVLYPEKYRGKLSLEEETPATSPTFYFRGRLSASSLLSMMLVDGGEGQKEVLDNIVDANKGLLNGMAKAWQDVLRHGVSPGIGDDAFQQVMI